MIEERLAALVPEQGALFEAARYSLLGGGKRLRPRLLLATVEDLHGSVTAALTPACALEMVHAFSLIHDDLPCMDDDDLRRGKPTLHKVYSEGHAVLSGDFLLSRAFQVVAKEPLLTAEQKTSIIALLAEGTNGMIQGQVLDLATVGQDLALHELEEIYLGKTAALFRTAVECGGIVAHATPEMIAILRNVGESLGLVFQIMDDILDATSDMSNNKSTYVTLLGVPHSQEIAKGLLEKAIAKLPTHMSTLISLAKSLTIQV